MYRRLSWKTISCDKKRPRIPSFHKSCQHVKCRYTDICVWYIILNAIASFVPQFISSRAQSILYKICNFKWHIPIIVVQNQIKRIQFTYNTTENVERYLHPHSSIVSCSQTRLSTLLCNIQVWPFLFKIQIESGLHQFPDCEIS